MALLVALAVAALLVLTPIVLMPLSLFWRYRMGSARRRARGWVATLNLIGIVPSVTLFIAAAAVVSAWVPTTLSYAALGLAGGCLLGLGGLWLSRWETTPDALHYTPNAWLVLTLMVVVAGRMVYGFWRAWHAWASTPGDGSWLAASGAAGSFAAGAVVLGYYLIYWVGVWRRARGHRRAAAAG